MKVVIMKETVKILHLSKEHPQKQTDISEDLANWEIPLARLTTSNKIMVMVTRVNMVREIQLVPEETLNLLTTTKDGKFESSPHQEKNY